MQKILHKQRHLWAALFTIFTMFGCWSAQAQLLTEEFNYGATAGNLIGVSGGNWIAHNAGGMNPVIYGTTSLTFPTYPNLGGRASISGTSEDINRSFTSQTSSVYFSAVISVSTAAAGGDYFLHFAQTSGAASATFVDRVFIRSSGAGFQLGLSRNTTTVVYDATVYTFNTPILVAIKHEVVAGTFNDIGKLFIFTAAPPTTEPAATVTDNVINTTADPAGLAAICIRQGGASSAPSVLIDYIRVGTTWTDVTSGASVPPDIAISSPAQTTAGNVAQGTTNHILSAFQLAVTTGAANLTGLTVTTAGNYAVADLTNLKVRYSTDNILDGGDATLSTITPTTAGTQAFTPFTAQSIAIGNGFIFVTADVAAGAVLARNISVGAIAPADITFTSSASKTGSATAAGLQTIIAPTSATVALSSPAQIAAANVPQGTNNRVISAFQLGVTTANANLTGLSITTAVGYTATDLNNLKVWYQNNGTFNAGTATLLSTKTTGLGAGTHIFPSFVAQTIPNPSTGFIFVTADVAMTANVGATINVNAIANTDLTFTAATVTGTATIGGVQTVTATVGTTIAAARAMALGTVVTLTGTITVAKQFGGTIYMQDATGGIAIFDNRTGNPLFNDANLAVGKFCQSTCNCQEFTNC